jgi:DNA gyrase subunit B
MVENSPFSINETQVLSGLEAVRRRPGMYLGDPHDGSGLHHLVWEVVGNAIDQHLARRVRHLRVDLRDGWVTVEDDGPGIPDALLERVLTHLFVGGTFDGHHPHVHVGIGFHGCGLAPVNAMSARFEVESRFRGSVFRIACERGRVIEPMTCAGESATAGTRVRFRPDSTIFSSDLEAERIEARLRELAWLHPLLEVRWNGQTLDNRRGLVGWLEAIAETNLITPIVSTCRSSNDVRVDIAFAWRTNRACEMHAFVNTQRSVEGTHVMGFWDALVDRFPRLHASVVREVLSPGLIVILDVGLLGPEWDTPTRSHLRSPIARRAVNAVVGDALAASRVLTEFLFDRVDA